MSKPSVNDWEVYFLAAIHGGAGAIALHNEARVPPDIFVAWCDEVAKLASNLTKERILSAKRERGGK